VNKNHEMRSTLALSFLCTVFVTGCRTPHESAANITPAASPSPSTAATVKSKVDVCNLLTSDDLKAVQGEAFKEAQRSDRIDGNFVVAQCYYAMPNTVNSVVVNVTSAKDEAGARSPKEYWEQTFGRDEEKGREGEREKEKTGARARDKDNAKGRERGEEGEERESPPQRVNALGDEAFWVGSAVGGALYVLKNDLFFRVSIGGGDQKSKLNKSRELAETILKNLR
jgi:hypothetical protein